jgi:hypothetical protein
MGFPAKNWNAYAHFIKCDIQVPVPKRKDIVCEKHYNASGQRVKTGFEPNGKVCVKPTKGYD